MNKSCSVLPLRSDKARELGAVVAGKMSARAPWPDQGAGWVGGIFNIDCGTLLLLLQHNIQIK